MTRKLFGVGIGVLGCLVVAEGAAWAVATPAAKCAAAKQKGAGMLAVAKLTCYATATTKAVPVDPSCLSKAYNKFIAAYAKAESAGGCAINGDALYAIDDVNAAVAPIAAQASISPCANVGDPCGSTCAGGGQCFYHCTGNPYSSGLVCVNPGQAVGAVSGTTGDGACANEHPGTLMFAGSPAICVDYFTTLNAICAPPCP